MATSNRTKDYTYHEGYEVLNGTSTGKNDDRFDVWVEYEVTQNEQNVTNNTSAIKAYFYAALKPNDKGTDTYRSSGLNSSFEINGVSGNVASNKEYDFRSASIYNLLGNYSGTIAHNADGTKSIAIKGSFTTKSDYISGGSISKTLTLPTIARASAPTVSTTRPAMGTAFTIYTNRASSAFTHTLTYSFAGKTGTIATKVGASYAWTPPYSLAASIPSATSGTCRITCTTYNGSSEIGSKYVDVTLTVPNNATTKPSVTLTLAPYRSKGSSAANTDTTDPLVYYPSTVSLKGKYLKGKSKVLSTYGSTAKLGATIKSCSLTVGGKTYALSTTGSSHTSAVLANAGTRTVVLKVVDSRGFTNEIKRTITVIDYTEPTLTGVQVYRCTASGAKNENGTYVYVKAKRTYSKLAGQNTLTGATITQGNISPLSVRYKKRTATSYGDFIALIPATDTTTTSYAGVLSGVTLDTLESYDFQVYTHDAVGVAKTIIFPVSTVQTDFNLNNNKAAFGKYAEKNKTLEVDWDIYCYGNQYVNSKGTQSSVNLISGASAQYKANFYCNDNGNIGLWDEANETAILRYNAGQKKITSLALDASLLETTGTITGSTNVTMGAHTLKNNPFVNAVFVRLGCTTKVAFSANTNYAIGTIPESFAASALVPLITAAQKGTAWLNGNTIYFRAFDAVASGTNLYISGFWMK